MLNQVLTTVYSANGLLAALVYLPQIRAIWNDASGAKSISLVTWSVWATTSTVTFLYGWQVLHDRPMMVASASAPAGRSRYCSRRCIDADKPPPRSSPVRFLGRSQTADTPALPRQPGWLTMSRPFNRSIRASTCGWAHKNQE
jgi:hypothetical protein